MGGGAPTHSELCDVAYCYLVDIKYMFKTEQRAGCGRWCNDSPRANRGQVVGGGAPTHPELCDVAYCYLVDIKYMFKTEQRAGWEVVPTHPVLCDVTYCYLIDIKYMFKTEQRAGCGRWCTDSPRQNRGQVVGGGAPTHPVLCGVAYCYLVDIKYMFKTQQRAGCGRWCTDSPRHNRLQVVGGGASTHPELCDVAYCYLVNIKYVFRTQQRVVGGGAPTHSELCDVAYCYLVNIKYVFRTEQRAGCGRWCTDPPRAVWCGVLLPCRYKIHVQDTTEGRLWEVVHRLTPYKLGVQDRTVCKVVGGGAPTHPELCGVAYCYLVNIKYVFRTEQTAGQNRLQVAGGGALTHPELCDVAYCYLVDIKYVFRTEQTAGCGRWCTDSPRAGQNRGQVVGGGAPTHPELCDVAYCYLVDIKYMFKTEQRQVVEVVHRLTPSCVMWHCYLVDIKYVFKTEQRAGCGGGAPTHPEL
ncbi:hypothetical protein J6590_063684 [Homalodisca vitripennis]|nr:hypothetical protein J6590_063684 [Homalodisca vitripennis]